MLQPIATVAARVADLARGSISAVWPRGAVSYEMSRLLEEGYTSGERCDVAFSVYFVDPAMAAAAAQAVRAARYVVDTTQSARGFITVHENLQLRAFDLGLALARLERIVDGYEGFVALIGPTHPSPRATHVLDDATAETPEGQLAA
jgi:hypothetical protein